METSLAMCGLCTIVLHRVEDLLNPLSILFGFLILKANNLTLLSSDKAPKSGHNSQGLVYPDIPIEVENIPFNHGLSLWDLFYRKCR